VKSKAIQKSKVELRCRVYFNEPGPIRESNHCELERGHKGLHTAGKSHWNDGGFVHPDSPCVDP